MEHFYIDGISFDETTIIENWNMYNVSGCNILSGVTLMQML